MEWIKASEQLPKTDSNVLTYVRINKNNVRYISISWYEPLDKEWFSDNQVPLIDDGHFVEFWQPLPESPK